MKIRFTRSEVSTTPPPPPDVYLTANAVMVTLPRSGLQQAPGLILTTAPLLRSTIPGSTSRAIRIAAPTFLFTWSNRPCSGISTRLRGEDSVSSTQFTRKPMSLPIRASLMGLSAALPREKSAATTAVSTP